MPDGTQPPPPPPAMTYQPVPTQPASMAVRLPPWLELWGLIGLVIIFVGAILILVGFLYGSAYGSCVSPGSGCSGSTASGDIQAFFGWTGAGIFLTILGWIFRVFMAQWRAGKAAVAPMTAGVAAAAAPVAPTMVAAPVAPAAPAPPPAAPAAAPPTPACASCGKPTTYIAQYGRYYCYSCARYV